MSYARATIANAGELLICSECGGVVLHNLRAHHDAIHAAEIARAARTALPPSLRTQVRLARRQHAVQTILR